MTLWLHATAVAFEERAALITGASGTGKSTLALKLLAQGCVLISDDRVGVAIENDRLVLLAHPEGQGRIEARNIGLLQGRHRAGADLALVIDLEQTASSRLPAPDVWSYRGYDVPLLPGKTAAALPEITLLWLRGDYRLNAL